MKTTIAAGLAAGALALTGCTVQSPDHQAQSTPAPFALERQGLLIDDGFHRPKSLSQLQERYELNGSAPEHDRFASVDSAGLHVGVREHEPGVFEGYFAVTHDVYPASSVFQVRMARQNVDVPQKDRSGEAVFAVQTGTTKKTGVINYVLVASSTHAGMTHWLVGSAEGKVADAKTTVLWETPYLETAKADRYQDITLGTNGRTSLEVWFGARLVFSSHRLRLHIDAPLQPYLEVQGLETGYISTFTDFSVVSDSSLTILGLHPHETVSFVPGHHDAISAVASATGEAHIPLPLPMVRGTATVTLGRYGGRRLGPFTYAGGDVDRVVPGSRPESQPPRMYQPPN